MNDDAIKEPSHSMEAEQSILGGLLLDNEGWDRIADVVVEQDFYAHDHRYIFRAISRLLEANKAADVITVAEFLEKHGLLADMGGLPYLGNLVQNTPSAANIRRYAEIVRERALVRRVDAAAMDVREKVYARGGMSAAELVDYAQAKMQSVSELASKGGSGPQMLADVMGRVSEKIDELSCRDDPNEVTGLPTGFHQLDKMTSGLQPGDLVILAARPSMGKTALALNIAEHVGVNLKKPVAVFSLEMINEQLGLRLMSAMSGIHAQRVRVGRIYDGEWQRINEALKRVQDAPIWLDEDASITPTELRTRARRIHRECGGLSLVVIDYLQLMNIDGSGDNRAIELGKVTRGLKHLAKELHCPVIVLSQLNRGLEARPNKRPIMSDLRDSGSIEQDADIVLFVYRDEVYNEDSPDKGLAELIIGKQRNGPTGRVVVNFEGTLTRFTDRNHHEPLPSASLRVQKRENRAGKFRAKKDSFGGDHVDI